MSDDLAITLVRPRVRAPEPAPPSAIQRLLARLFGDTAPLRMAPAVSLRALVALGATIWLVTRLGLLVFTFMTSLFEATHATPARVMFPSVTIAPLQLLREWQKWAAPVSQQVARHGYIPSSTPFFPLFPLLIRLGLFFTAPANAWLVALIINNLMALIGCVGLVFFAYQETGSYGDARRTLVLLLAYPLAFFLSAPYTEGLLLAAAAWSLWAARRGNWWLAATCVFLGVLSRPTGMTLAAPVIVEFLRQHDWGRRLRRLQPSTAVTARAVLVAGPAALGVFSLVCWRATGDPLMWLRIDRLTYGRSNIPVWKSLYEGISFYLARPAWSFDLAHHMTDFIPFVVMSLITLALAVRQPLSFTLYMLGLLYLVVAAPMPVGWPTHHWAVYTSAGRYLLPSLPVWLALGRWAGRRPWLESLLLYVGILIQAVCATQYLLGRWMV